MQMAFQGFCTALLRAVTVCCILIAALSSATAQTPAEHALAVYEDGKRRYDAQDYAGARSKFIEASRIEPDNPRWHYNLGLTHRQMDNFQAARQSLLRARELDPNYKRAEIDQKLLAMGFDAAGSGAGAHAQSSDQASLATFLVPGIVTIIAGFVALFWTGLRAARGTAPDAAAVAPLENRLRLAAERLVKVEHALRLGEAADLRSQLDHATRLEGELRTRLEAAAKGDQTAFRKAQKGIAELEASVSRALEQAKAAFGEQAFAGQGEKVACYFCARPLANPAYRRVVAVKRGEQRDEVLSCPDCADEVRQGNAPAVLAAPDGRTHWSELNGFDPYAARHAANSGTEPVPAWRFQPQRSPGELALLGGGAALAVLLASRPAQAGESLLDLDAAAEAGLAQEAAKAAAKRAAASRRERDSDHS